MTLSDLNRYTPASITAITGPADIQTLLREIGFSEYEEVEVLGAGPVSGSPLSIRLNRTVIALRRTEAALIEVEPI